MIDVNTLQTFSGMPLKEIIMHPLVFAAWSATLIAMVIAFGKELPVKIFERIKHYLTIVLTIDESENVSGYDIFDSFNKWVIDHRIEWLSRSFEVDMSKKIQSGQGFQVVKYEGSLFLISMARREPKGQNSFKTIGYYTIVTAKWNRSKLNKMVHESTAIKDYGQIMIVDNLYSGECIKYDYPSYIYNQKQLISKKVYERISDTFENFNNGRKSYDDKNIPYKETIMLYGPPGTGKTSLIRHLAAKHNMNLILLNSEDFNTSLVAKITAQSKYKNTKNVILLEDITSHPNLLKKQNIIKDEYGDEVSDRTLSKFLNTLDGANPLDNVIVVMTTNYINKLDPAIYRPGRVDHNICMEYMNLDEVEENVLGWGQESDILKYIKSIMVEDKLTANTIMKLQSLSIEDKNKIDVVIEDNDNFLKLFDKNSLEEV